MALDITNKFMYLVHIVLVLYHNDDNGYHSNHLDVPPYCGLFYIEDPEHKSYLHVLWCSKYAS